MDTTSAAAGGESTDLVSSFGNPGKWGHGSNGPADQALAQVTLPSQAKGSMWKPDEPLKNAVIVLWHGWPAPMHSQAGEGDCFLPVVAPQG